MDASLSPVTERGPTAVSIVEAIFAKLTLVYGREFLNRWQGIDIEMVKADWTRELRWTSTAGIRYALEHLPEKAPTVLTFRRLCSEMPRPVVSAQALPAPTYTADEIKRRVASLRALSMRLKSRSSRVRS